MQGFFRLNVEWSRFDWSVIIKTSGFVSGYLMGDILEKLPRAQTDIAWKEILRLYLKDFFERCWPVAYQQVDWNRPYEFLEQEFQAIGIKEKFGTKIVDKLFKLYLKNGQEQWVLCHIELQSTVEVDFVTRMYVYDYRIYDRYQKNITSLAVLLDCNMKWRPNRYSRKI